MLHRAPRLNSKAERSALFSATSYTAGSALRFVRVPPISYRDSHSFCFLFPSKHALLLNV